MLIMLIMFIMTIIMLIMFIIMFIMLIIMLIMLFSKEAPNHVGEITTTVGVFEYMGLLNTWDY